MEFELISANYNNAKYLDVFFQSLIQSTQRPKTLIIVDDCSSDNSVEIINSYKELLNINLVINEQNQGFANSLNIALGQVTAPCVARLDPDDYVAKNRFELQMKFLTDNPDFGGVGSDVIYVKNDTEIGVSNVPKTYEKIKNLTGVGIIAMIHGTLMLKSENLREFRYKQELVPAEDFDLLAFLIHKGILLSNIPHQLTYVNIHDKSVSNDLKWESVSFRYELARKYFGHKESNFNIKREFFHLKFYRKYMASSGFLRNYYLMIAVAVKPLKVLNRILKR